MLIGYFCLGKSDPATVNLLS